MNEPIYPCSQFFKGCRCPGCESARANAWKPPRRSGMAPRTIAIILALFLGGLGAHKFYLGQVGWGVAYAMFAWTLVPALVALIEVFGYLFMSEDEFSMRYRV